MAKGIWDTIIVGGGAAGFFTAIRIKELNPNRSVVILEKTQKILSKVRISGGGRCNVTHHCLKNSQLLQHYPRGKKLIKKAVNQFNVEAVIAWFLSHGVQLKVEEDGRMFPVSNNSETIAGLFEQLAEKFNIPVIKGCQVLSIQSNSSEEIAPTKNNRWTVHLNSETMTANAIVLATGGNVAWSHYQWLNSLPISIIKPFPSLFTFNIKDKELQALTGVAVEMGSVKMIGYDNAFDGPILITHWGLSGPAILKSSAWAAQWIFERNYQFNILVSWVLQEENQFREYFYELLTEHSKKKIINLPIDLPQRLWCFILNRAGQNTEQPINELNKNQKNKLVELIVKMPFMVAGKTTFKEEFVTAGGVDEQSLNTNTLELKHCPGVYACGELLDVDGITGGFNFQAAWSTANLVANSIAYSPFSENL
jgi:predicted Rossmann fold flavoprotein